MNITEAATAAADPFAKPSVAFMAEHVADVAQYLVANWDANILYVEASFNAGESIHLSEGADILRRIGTPVITPNNEYICLTVVFKGVKVFTLVKEWK